MIRVLLVEDEAPIRKGIYRHVHWEELGVDEVLQAENAEIALEIGEEYLPDIIVSDIRMPGMYGTELCRAYRSRVPDSQIIFISGYSDKEYLTAAIELGAVGYIEKPIDLQELSEAIRKAVRNIRRIDRAHRSALHILIHAQKDDRQAAADVYDNLLQKVEGKEHHLLLRISGKERLPDLNQLAESVIGELSAENTEDQFYALTDNSTENTGTILFSATREWDRSMQESVCMTFLSLGTENSRWFLTVSNEISAMEQISAAYEDVKREQAALSWMGWNQWTALSSGSTEFSGTIPEEQLRDLYKALSDKNGRKAAENLIDAWSSRLISERAQMSFAVRNSFYAIDREIRHAARTQAGTRQEETEDTAFLDEAVTIVAMRDYVKDHAKRILGESSELKSNYAVRTVCEYVRNHIQEEDLTAAVLAEAVYLTPSYLSGLFKKVMGITLVQYITDQRMQKACELLGDPQKKLYQVADAVGYSDAKYFARQFKKTIGLTPSEYREQL